MNLPCLRESCPNFLRPIYHSLSANQAPRRGMPHEKYQYRLQLLFFYLIVTWPIFNCHGTDLLGGRYTTTVSYWSLTDAVCFKLHYLQVSVPEPCPITDAFRQPLDRLLENVIVFLLLMLILDIWYPSAVFPGHKLSRSSGYCKSPLQACRLSRLMMASFSMGFTALVV